MLKNIILILLALVVVGVSHTVFSADSPAGVAMPASPANNEATKESSKVSVSQPANNTRPINDNHVDYRYCLELKTDLEIIKCRYKK